MYSSSSDPPLASCGGSLEQKSLDTKSAIDRRSKNITPAGHVLAELCRDGGITDEELVRDN